MTTTLLDPILWVLLSVNLAEPAEPLMISQPMPHEDCVELARRSGDGVVHACVMVDLRQGMPLVSGLK